MKLGKAQRALLLVTALFVTFTLAFFLGRRSIHAQVTTERLPETEESAPAAQTRAPETDAVPTRQAPPARIELNSADAATREGLPGIGPVLAQAIVEYRAAHGPFSSVDELLEVSGIGETKLDNIRNDITLGEEDAA